MAQFNTKEFLTNTQGTPEALGNAFGLPSCMLNLAANALALLPMDILQAMRMDAIMARMAAEEDIAAFVAWIRDNTGLNYIFDENGRLKFLSIFSRNGIDLFGFITKILAYISAIRDFAADMYATIQDIEGQIQDIKRCFDQYESSLKSKTSGYDNDTVDNAVSELQFLQKSVDFITDVNSLLARIDTEIAARVEDPTREPRFTTNNGVDLNTLLSFTTEAQIVDIAPPQEEIFRLTYGPPKSRFGRFLLSNDGIYFDSQTDAASGLTLAFTEIARKRQEYNTISSLFWKFEQDPNLGGRGKGLSLTQVKEYVDNILDIYRIDEAEDLLPYYDADNYLEQLTAHKNKRLYDLSAIISELEADPLASQAEIVNTRQSLLSELAAFQNKVNKRKKQIELAIRLGNGRYTIGNVPINDFSYLEGTNLFFDIQKQRELVLDQDDVNGIILPIQATYVVPPKDQTAQTIDHLLLSIIGEANILNSASSYESDTPTVLRGNTEIVKDQLLAVYNFLETNIESASSTSYLLDNCITNNNNLNARLIASSLANVFPKGLGIPYLNGVVKFDSAGTVLGFNNHVMLPSVRQFDDLFYNTKGTTIDFWIHTSSLIPQNQGSVQQMYKIILSNENTGALKNPTETNVNYITPDNSNNTVKGLLIGFTRDRRITKGLEASPLDASNIGSDTCFFIAPTQSLDGSTITFVNRSTVVEDTEDNCINTLEPLCFRKGIFETGEDGVCLSSIQDSFCHMALSFDPKNDNISVYFNGKLLSSSSLSTSLCISKTKTLNVPTFVVNKDTNLLFNSFSYTTSSLSPTSKINYGFFFNNEYRSVNNHYKFTPWVLGGGFTDGLPYGNFMGSIYSGQRSALDGYLGSVKFYNKALTKEEIVNNYTAQAQFFSNIDLS